MLKLLKTTAAVFKRFNIICLWPALTTSSIQNCKSWDINKPWCSALFAYNTLSFYALPYTSVALYYLRKLF